MSKALKWILAITVGSVVAGIAYLLGKKSK